MRIIAFITAVLLSSAGQSLADDAHYIVRISGVVAEKLPRDTAMVFWSPRTDIHPSRSFSVRSLPLKLPADQFTGWPWYLDFRDASNDVLFSVRLSRDLFDKPRTINVLLDEPKPRINPKYFPTSLQYTANITQRMQYRDLPYWDEAAQAFRPAQPPVITLSDLDTGKLLKRIPMEAGCMAEKWWAITDDAVAIPKGARLRFKVEYDSGGLFDKIVTQRDMQKSPTATALSSRTK